VVSHAPSPRPGTPQHRAAATKQAATKQAATAPTTPSRAPAAAAQSRASRDLARISLAAAQRLANQLDAAPAVQGLDPVTRLLDFVAINATLS
jgi:hypothetical protein